MKVKYKVTGYSNNRIHLKVEGNAINIYYEIDENQTKELKYTVEYYKDNELVEDDTQIETVTVQVLEPDELEVAEIDKEKYEGYNFIKTDPKDIPEKIQDGSVIKVYYESPKNDTIEESEENKESKEDNDTNKENTKGNTNTDSYTDSYIGNTTINI